MVEQHKIGDKSRELSLFLPLLIGLVRMAPKMARIKFLFRNYYQYMFRLWNAHMQLRQKAKALPLENNFINHRHMSVWSTFCFSFLKNGGVHWRNDYFWFQLHCKCSIIIISKFSMHNFVVWLYWIIVTTLVASYLPLSLLRCNIVDGSGVRRQLNRLLTQTVYFHS